MSQCSITLLGLSQNCAKTLPIFFSFIEELRRNGVKSSVFIGENGSKDGTREILNSQVRAEFNVIDTIFMSKIPQRLARMARGRQYLMDVSRQCGSESEFTFVIDLDNAMKSPPSIEGILKSLRMLRDREDLFAVGANSYPAYYDLLSLKTDDLDPIEFHAELMAAKKSIYSYYKFHKERIYEIQESISRTVDVNCYSSFNGFCIYKSKLYYQGSYRGGDEERVCEHVTINANIGRRTGAHMLISSLLQIEAPAEHQRVGFFKFWSDRIRSKLTF